MTDELTLNGKNYVSSKQAADTTGYARDYIGQLARGGLIDAERVGGLWYVSLDSLGEYEKNAEAARALTPVPSQATREVQSSLVFEGKDYISASRASKISGYNQDYVGQLARGGKIPSRQIGNRWYVDKDALLAHKSEKDALLAAVQSESVGLQEHPVPAPVPVMEPLRRADIGMPTRYITENKDLIPSLGRKEDEIAEKTTNSIHAPVRAPIVQEKYEVLTPVSPMIHMPARMALTEAEKRAPKSKKKRLLGLTAGALTIILVLSIGITAIKHTAVFANVQGPDRAALMATTAQAANTLGDRIEDIVSPELRYESDHR